MSYGLTQRQIEALKDRFGAVLDVDEEIRAATDYAVHFHRGPRYKNFGLFVHKWCVRAAADPKLRRRRYTIQTPAAPPPAAPAVSRAQLQAILNDPAESEQMRSLALEQLQRMDAK